MANPQNLPGEHHSLWLATTPQTGYPALSGDLRVDVAIVGGGIAGLTTAILLKQRGKRVAVIERGHIAEHVTGHTTAKITSQHNLIYDHLIRSFDEETAHAYGAANQAAIEFVASFAASERIECDFRRAPAYTYTEKQSEVEQIEAEVKAAQKLGLPAEFVTETPLPIPFAGAIRFANQAYFHPRKYLIGMAQMIPGDGSHLLENTTAREFKEGTPCQVITDRGTVTADDVVMASHFPFQDNALYFARMSPNRSYLTAMTLNGPIPEGMYITVDARHTLRGHVTAEGQEYLLVGGEGHKTGHGGDTVERYARIEEWARQHFPVKQVVYSWSTQDYNPFDRIPYIGRSSPTSPHVYVATGFKEWGMSSGTVAGILLCDLITEQENPWAKVFDPNRVTLAGTKKLVEENLHVAKEFAVGYFSSPSHEDVPVGEGRIVEGDDGKVAVYRAEDGTLHTSSPICTHMGCIVDWNPAEKSWDCPCHGSRFSAEGEVLHGPADKALAKKELVEK